MLYESLPSFKENLQQAAEGALSLIPEAGKADDLPARQKPSPVKVKRDPVAPRTPEQKSGKIQRGVKLGNGERRCHLNISISK